MTLMTENPCANELCDRTVFIEGDYCLACLKMREMWQYGVCVGMVLTMILMYMVSWPN